MWACVIHTHPCHPCSPCVCVRVCVCNRAPVHACVRPKLWGVNNQGTLIGSNQCPSRKPQLPWCIASKRPSRTEQTGWKVPSAVSRGACLCSISSFVSSVCVCLYLHGPKWFKYPRVIEKQELFWRRTTEGAPNPVCVCCFYVRVLYTRASPTLTLVCACSTQCQFHIFFFKHNRWLPLPETALCSRWNRLLSQIHLCLANKHKVAFLNPKDLFGWWKKETDGIPTAVNSSHKMGGL